MSIPGIGPVAAIAMLVEMPELGTMDGEEAASLASITRESGRWKGQSLIGGWRRGLRWALYMPALVATRHNGRVSQRLV